jgi:hypothetical protein
MLGCPFKNQNQRPLRQSSFQNFEGPNVDQHFIFALKRMEVRRSMILPEHLDCDAVEERDRRHRNRMSL